MKTAGQQRAEFSFYELGKEDYQALAERAIAGARVKDERPSCNFSGVELATVDAPIFFAFVQGVHGSLTSQIAVKMSLEQMVDTAMEQEGRFDGKQFLQTIFKTANARVYEYGQQMVAGGQVAATGFAGICDGKRISIARVGSYESYLRREDSTLRFYEGEAKDAAAGKAGVTGNFIGAGKHVLVDIAATDVQAGDVILMTSYKHNDAFLETLEEVLEEESDLDELAITLAQEGAFGGLVSAQAKDIVVDENGVVCVVRIKG